MDDVACSPYIGRPVGGPGAGDVTCSVAVFVLGGVACSVAVRGRDEDVLPVWGLSRPAAISNALAAILEHGGITIY